MTWLLLRGLTREARHWGRFAEQLGAQLPAGLQDRNAVQEVLALDLPGNGLLCRQPSPASVAAMVEALRAQLSAAAVRRPFSLLAMSLGGMVAAEWARRYPQEVSRLVLVNTSMRPFGAATERLRPASWPHLAQLAGCWRDPRAETIIHSLTCAQTATLEEDLAAWRGIRATAPVRPANACRQLLAAARYSGGAQAPCPTLVLSSGCDRLVNPICSARLAQAWAVPHHQHPWGGHDLPHDDPGWVLSRLTSWLAAQ
jgi:pimeloyl-ACP methyl ester carboxylesterase